MRSDLIKTRIVTYLQVQLSNKNIKIYIESNPKTQKLLKISRESEKEAKPTYDSYPTEFVS
jgi:hypothetical protein